mgnify:CR=1 FL=1
MYDGGGILWGPSVEATSRVRRPSPPQSVEAFCGGILSRLLQEFDLRHHRNLWRHSVEAFCGGILWRHSVEATSRVQPPSPPQSVVVFCGGILGELLRVFLLVRHRSL